MTIKNETDVKYIRTNWNKYPLVRITKVDEEYAKGFRIQKFDPSNPKDAEIINNFPQKE
jgi:hypothetical protein